MKKLLQSAIQFSVCFLLVLMLPNALCAQSPTQPQLPEGVTQITPLESVPLPDPAGTKPTYQYGKPVTNQNLGTDVQNQSSVTTGTNQSGTQPQVEMSGAKYMNTVVSGSAVYKDANGGSRSVNPDGSVVVNSTNSLGIPQVITISKPVIDQSKTRGTGVSEYIAQYKEWMHANPDFMNFVSASEKNYIIQDDFEGLYKSNYVVSSRKSLNK